MTLVASRRPDGVRDSERPLHLDVALLPQAVHHLGDGGGGVADALGQTSLDHLAALLFQVEDRLEVLLVGRVGAGPAGNVAHAASVLLRRRRPQDLVGDLPGRGRGHSCASAPRGAGAPGRRREWWQTLGVERPVDGGWDAREGRVMALLMLLDGNSLTYRAFFALPTDLATASGQVTNAVYGFTSMLVNLIKDHKPDYLVVAFDRPEPTFRHELVAGYKATRSAAPDILRQQMGLVRQLVETMRIPVVEAPGYEADDVLATLATRAAAEGDDVIVVTGDRDTYQLVEDPHLKVLYNRRGVSDYVLYDEAGILERTGVTPAQYPDFASLRGDPSDNLPGVPGVGEKTAAKLITTYGDLDGVYAHLDELTPRSARLAHRRRGARCAATPGSYRWCATWTCPSTPGEAAVGGWDVAELRRLFEFLEFRTLWDRFVDATGTGKAGRRRRARRPASSWRWPWRPWRAPRRPPVPSRSGPVRGAALAVAGSWEGREGRSPLSGLAFAVVGRPEDGAEPADGAEAAAPARRPAVPGPHGLVARRGAPRRCPGAGGPGRPARPGRRRPVSAHDAKALMRSLAVLGVDFANLQLDTSIAAYLVDPAGDQYLLEDLAARFAGMALAPAGTTPSGQLDLSGAAEPGRMAAERAVAVARLVPSAVPRLGPPGHVPPVRRGRKATGQGPGPHGARRGAGGLGRARPPGPPAGRRGPRPGEPGPRPGRHPVPGQLGAAAARNPLRQARSDPGEKDQDGLLHGQPDAGEAA